MVRAPLPARRYCEHFTLNFGNHEYNVGVGYYPDGRVGEIFVDAGKAGSELATTSNDLAIAVSRLLQMGVPLEDLRRSFARTEEGYPVGIISAILDRVALMLLSDQQAAE